MAEGFFGRWSHRKLAERQRAPMDEPKPETQAGAAPAVVPTHAVPAPAPSAPAMPDGTTDDDATIARQAPAPALTMQDVAALHKNSDFKPFVARTVPPEVRNAALKKLFGDPHFNVMDGLDTYIDDYSQPDPLPAAMLRQMASAQFLKLFDDDRQGGHLAGASDGEPGADIPREDADGATPQVVAQSPPEPDNDAGAMSNPNTGHMGPHDDDTDLRLQPDDATGPARPRSGTE